jgi:hypothetical protein
MVWWSYTDGEITQRPSLPLEGISVERTPGDTSVE